MDSNVKTLDICASYQIQYWIWYFLSLKDNLDSREFIWGFIQEFPLRKLHFLKYVDVLSNFM